MKEGLTPCHCPHSCRLPVPTSSCGRRLYGGGGWRQRLQALALSSEEGLRGETVRPQRKQGTLVCGADATSSPHYPSTVVCPTPQLVYSGAKKHTPHLGGGLTENWPEPVCVGRTWVLRDENGKPHPLPHGQGPRASPAADSLGQGLQVSGHMPGRESTTGRHL